LKSTHLDVISGNVTEQGHQRIALLFDRRLDIGIGRFHRAPHSAKDVDFPTGVEPCSKKIARAVAAK
jgi:hypothetical protein